MSRPVAGKVIVITGAARGIGLTTARTLLENGARLGLCDIDEVALKSAASELPQSVVAGRVDVTDPDSFGAFLDQVERELGPIDVLINNAGIMPVGLLADEPFDVTTRTLDVNLLGVITGSKLAAQRMAGRSTGHIINIASVAGESAVGGMATYHASKWGALGFTLSLSVELESQGIEVTAVLPAFVDTELTAGHQGSRFVAKVSPQDVADGIIGAIRSPKPKVYVPKIVGAISNLAKPLPLRVQRRIQRILIPAGSMLSGVDAVARKAYDERIGLR